MQRLPDDTDLEKLIEMVAERVADRIELQVTNAVQRKFISRSDYARNRGIGLRSVDRAIAEGRLDSIHIGRRRLIPVDAVIQG